MRVPGVGERVAEAGRAPGGVDFTSHVAEWIRACRESGGYPIFKTHYGGYACRDEKGRPVLQGVCLGGDPTRRPQSVWFVNVPEEDWRIAYFYTGEHRYFLWKYGGGREKGEPEPALARRGTPAPPALPPLPAARPPKKSGR